MPALFQSPVKTFLDKSVSELVGILSVRYAAQGFTDQKTDQTETWAADIARLQESLRAAALLSFAINDWHLILEFVIPRKAKRIDVVLVTGSSILILELKTGVISKEASRQIEEYGLLLHYFHKPSYRRRLLPFVISPFAVSTDASLLAQAEFQFEELASTWIAPTTICNWEVLAERLVLAVTSLTIESRIDAETWADGAYYPVPTIIEAALALRNGLEIREIAHSEASEHEISAVTGAIQAVIREAKEGREFVICLLTGVPGSGKTLVGLGLAHSRQENRQPIHFMSGNGPLVKVLQHLFTRQAMLNKIPAPEARIQARTLIENVHLFAKHYADDAPNEVPSNHVIIFDEAQRAWNREQNLKKFGRGYSEPEMLLSIMERHEEWAVVVALVGGGQEINDGEAGLEEWGKALQNSRRRWKVFASPEVLSGGESTAGHVLFEKESSQIEFTPMHQLHLRTSNRSLRAENLAKWVNAVIAGNSRTACDLGISAQFPILLTRNMEKMKETIRAQSLGESRYGLVGSSGATRLRAEGLEPDSAFHASYRWEHWYLAGKGDVRASFQCEVFATEFEIQGLELDWVGLCWGGDFIWSKSAGWLKRKFRPGLESKWSPIKNGDKQKFRENAYRVLLIRARQGLVIFIPKGDIADPTRKSSEFDATAQFLQECGVKNVDGS